MQRRAEAGFPEFLAGLGVESLEVAVEVTHEGKPAAGAQHAGEEHRVLRVCPALLQRLHVPGTQAAVIPVGARHGQHFRFAAVAAAAFHHVDLAPDEFHAELLQRNDQ